MSIYQLAVINLLFLFIHIKHFFFRLFASKKDEVVLTYFTIQCLVLHICAFIEYHQCTLKIGNEKKNIRSISDRRSAF